MNPSVINNNNNGGGNTNGDHPAASVPQQNAQSSDADTNNNSNNNNHHNSSAHTRTSSDPRGFPSPFASTGRFAFDDSDDDMFGDLDMRARMNRLGGFDWGAHKRRGSGAGFPDASNYDQFFQNDFHQFPGFNSHLDAFNRAKPAAHQERRAPPAHPTTGSPSVDRSHFFNHVPDEFRHYFPESFGSSFSRMRPQQQAAQSPPSHPSMRQPQPPPRAEPQQHYQQQPPPPPVAAQRVPMEYAAARPKMSDAAIQTDILPADQTQNNLNQHGLRNTVDLGQKSQPELTGASDRAQSAPPTDPQTPISASKVAADGSFSNTGTSMTPQTATGNQNQFNYSQPPPTVPSQFTESQQAPAPQSPSGAAGNRMRTVPIQVEGRQGAPQPPIPAPAPAHRPEPFVPKPDSDVVDANNGPPPQTPHTTDCINKIQSIQTDVLDLMGAVDRFSGSRGDKEYMFIDEMLTRNLLKLDTIDTNGRESIRLARKEAIRCIQASITVLEAKAEQNSNKKKTEKAAAEAEAPKPDVPAAAAPVAEPPVDTGNIEQSLEEKLADFQRKSEERETVAPAAETPAVTHVSEVNINLNGA